MFWAVFASVWILLVASNKVNGNCSIPKLHGEAALSDSSKETFEEGSTIRLECNPGYQPNTSLPPSARRLTCDNGQWKPDPSSFSCQKKNCGHPGDIADGGYDPNSGHEFGDKTTAFCNKGYYMIGEPVRLCLASGVWDGQHPVCQAKTCGSPPDVTNGRVKGGAKQEYKHQELAEYECDSGYTMLGDSALQGAVECHLNGSWSLEPRCKVVQCAKPNFVNAERVEGGSGPYGYQFTLRYQCIKGYKMNQGDGRIICQEDGWSQNITCQVVSCQRPATTNAKPDTQGPYVYNDVLTYTCDENQELMGTNQLTCTSTGSWSSLPPTCGKQIPVLGISIGVLLGVCLVGVGIFLWKRKSMKYIGAGDTAVENAELPLRGEASPK